MTLGELLPESTAFSFQRRPIGVPGDLRLSWRLALVVLILLHSRGKKASLAKLHLLNGALRSQAAIQALRVVFEEKRELAGWRLSVEPALGRALDFARGEGLVSSESGPAYRLTPKGERMAKALAQEPDALVSEREFLQLYGSMFTEGRVKKLLSHRR